MVAQELFMVVHDLYMEVVGLVQLESVGRGG